ncbi:hypothetical protein HanXRQr2_Chr06g0254571 [Helianthus annuus]|uniref:Uncharacterized protein n=1 Tax=Helianthus annuus TaxID=4232 RepID=A0A9K3NJM8_HELAN|nr:hypothetical protein HanXRQr2_Chr06g0254571 [Helianthus annuus]
MGFQGVLTNQFGLLWILFSGSLKLKDKGKWCHGDVVYKLCFFIFIFITLHRHYITVVKVVGHFLVN